jgi:hypothetical protein
MGAMANGSSKVTKAAHEVFLADLHQQEVDVVANESIKTTNTTPRIFLPLVI